MRGKLLKCVMGVFTTTLGAVLGLIMFTLMETDNYLFLRQRSMGEAYRYILEEHSSVTNNTTNQNSSSSSETVTNGTGLNLLLINNINTASYIKEVLELCRDSQNKELVNNQEFSIPVSTILGIWTSETGYYSQANGIIPNSPIPWNSQTNSPYYNKAYGLASAKEMTPKGYEGTTAQKLGQTNWERGSGILQFDSRDYLRVARYNGVNNANRTKGDVHYVPDQIAGLQSFAKDGLQFVGISDASSITDVEFNVIFNVSSNMFIFKF